MIEIKAGVELPARREAVELRTADGLTLVGELSLPESGDPVATLVCLHPLPTAGGFMDSHIIRKAAARLPALAQLAVLRFNFRGVTLAARHLARASSATAVDEEHDLAAAMDVRRRARPAASVAARLVVRNRGRAQVRPAASDRGRDPALAAAAPHDRG